MMRFSTLCAPTAVTRKSTAVAVQAAAGEPVARLLGHRHRLAGQHRLVDLGLALQAARRRPDTFARAHLRQVARQQLGHRYVDHFLAP